MEHIEFENKLINMLLEGDDPVLKELRNQLIHSTVESREIDGAGFYTHYAVNKDIPPVANGKTFHFGDIYASYENIDYAFGFVLFINNWYLMMLEGYTLVKDTWPDDYSTVTLKCDTTSGKRNINKLRPKWLQ